MKVKGILLFIGAALFSAASQSSIASEVVYLNGVVTGGNCSLVTISSGTTGAPGMGNIYWSEKQLRCDGVSVARESSWTSQYGGSNCRVSLLDSSSYSLSGSVCSSATITSLGSSELVYSNGASVSSSCSISTTNSGTTGAPGLGTIWWYTKSFSCGGVHVARLSGYSSQSGSSNCSIYLENSNYAMTGNKCDSAKIYE